MTLSASPSMPPTGTTATGPRDCSTTLPPLRGPEVGSAALREAARIRGWTGRSVRASEAHTYRRLHKALDLPFADPLEGHDPCALCGVRGPLVWAWQWWGPARFARATKAERDHAARTRVCAEGCEN